MRLAASSAGTKASADAIEPHDEDGWHSAGDDNKSDDLCEIKRATVKRTFLHATLAPDDQIHVQTTQLLSEANPK